MANVIGWVRFFLIHKGANNLTLILEPTKGQSDYNYQAALVKPLKHQLIQYAPARFSRGWFLSSAFISLCSCKVPPA